MFILLTCYHKFLVKSDAVSYNNLETNYVKNFATTWLSCPPIQIGKLPKQKCTVCRRTMVYFAEHFKFSIANVCEKPVKTSVVTKKTSFPFLKMFYKHSLRKLILPVPF